MARKQSAWFSALVLVGLLLTSTPAGAQLRDFPTVKGNNARTGRNGDPNGSTPGVPFLGWTSRAFSPAVIDNTDFTDTTVPPFTGGPYDFNPTGSAFASTPLVAAAAPGAATNWTYPTLANETGNTYVPTRRARAVGTFAADFNLRVPAYFYTNCTPSAFGTDPTVAKVPADRRFFEWRFNATAKFSQSAAINVWLPVGPTLDGAGNNIFPQRYFVYEVDFGGGQRFVQVLDTFTAGGGFVHLGGPDTIFPITSTQGITVRLYNTVPRDPNSGDLLELINGNTLSQTGTDEDKVKVRVVYADAAQMSPAIGSINATPTSATLFNSLGGIRVTSAGNELTSGFENGQLRSFQKGVVSTYRYNNDFGAGIQRDGVPLWTYSPLEESNQGVNVDNTSASLTASFTTNTAPAAHQGADYATAPLNYWKDTFTANTPISTFGGASSTATYAPNLVDGSYQIFVFLPGDKGTQHFGARVRYDVFEGVTDTVWVVNQAVGGGWVQLGDRRFAHSVAIGGPLKVVVSSLTDTQADVTANKLVYTDAIRFVGTSDLGINSSPIHANALIARSPGAVPVATDVVIVADERGVIHCLDAQGNANGSTTQYWSYPSTPDSNNPAWFDPNLKQGSDPNPIAGAVYDGTTVGTIVSPLAEMPTAFNLSSGLVQRINGADYLYIATQNGRVYCIAMAGRGDFDAKHVAPWNDPASVDFPVHVPCTGSDSPEQPGGLHRVGDVLCVGER